MTDQRAIDDGLRRQLAALGDRHIAGWKVGLTSGSARDSMGAGFRPFGYILPERVFTSGSSIPLAGIASPGIENELCFTLGRALEGDVGRREVLDAVDAVSPAFELNERRIGRNAPHAERLADGLAQWGIVVGAPRQLDWERFAFESIAVTLRCDGDLVDTVAAVGHIDDHFESLAALARQLWRFGRRIDAGARVITGSFTKHTVAGPSLFEGDFDAGDVAGIGQVAVEYA